MTLERRELLADVTVHALGLALAAAGVVAMLVCDEHSVESLSVLADQCKAACLGSGTTHTDFPIEIHETDLAPGMMPHPAHHHEHEEMVLLREGILEVTIKGNSSRLTPGSVAYVASNEEHGWKNVGDGRAKYFVIALGRKS